MNLSDTLKKLLKGTVAVLFSNILGFGIGFIARVILVRNVTPDEYGLFALGLTFFNILVLISKLGLQDGTTRFIAYEKEGKDRDDSLSIIKAGIQISIIGSLVGAVLIFLFANQLADLLKASGLASVLRIFAVGIPFMVLTDMIVSITRGFGSLKEKVLYQNILIPVLRAIAYVVVVIISLSIFNMVVGYVISVILITLLLVWNSRKTIFPRVKNVINGISKKLLSFSLPLLGSALISLIVTWSDIILIGYFQTTKEVGIYNGAAPFAKMIPIFITSLGFIYIPIIAQLYSERKIEEIKISYQVITKWTFSFSFPFFIMMFFYSDVLLDFVFGAQYASASLVLKVLSLGYIIHTFLGPNGSTLIVLGKTKFILWISLATALSNIVLNIILIPWIGVLGASISTAFVLIFSNLAFSWKIYTLNKIHSLNRSYLLPIFLTLIAFIPIYWISTFVCITFWMLPIAFLVSLGLYLIFLIITKSISENDLFLIDTISKKIGINLDPLKKLLKKI